jgi:hypothetical protein
MQGHASTRDIPELPEVSEQLNGENPARFLEFCEERVVTRVVVGLLRGMDDVDRVDAWIRVEEELYGGRSKPMHFLERRRDWLVGERGDGEAVPEEIVDDDAPVDAETSAGDVGDEGGRDADKSDESAAPTPEEPTSKDDFETEAAFERAVDEAYQTASLFDADDVERRLEQELERADPRQYVIAALNRRQREVASDVNSAASGEVTNA